MMFKVFNINKNNVFPFKVGDFEITDKIEKYVKEKRIIAKV